MATRPPKPRGARTINVTVDLAQLTPLAPNPEQLERLRALVKSQVDTWTKSDLKDTTVVCNENMT